MTCTGTDAPSVRGYCAVNDGDKLDEFSQYFSIHVCAALK